MKIKLFFILFFIEINTLFAEPLRVLVESSLLVSQEHISETSAALSYIGCAVISLGEDNRFLRGLEISIKVPQSYFAYRGSLAAVLYADLNKKPAIGVADLEARRIHFEALANKVQYIYQLPLQPNHGLRSNPYTVLLSTVQAPSFPLLFRIMPVIKGMDDDIEKMRFILSVKPILSNEGALKLSFRYPEQLESRAFSLLIDDVLIEKPSEELLLREGSHNIVIVSEHFRNENRLILIERGKTLDLTIDLHDPTPILSFEGPENARVFVDGTQVNAAKALPIEPGQHEVKFQLSDYSIIRPILVQKGKTYKITMTVNVEISESE